MLDRMSLCYTVISETFSPANLLA